MERVPSIKMWCFECQKEFISVCSINETICTICSSPIVEQIKDESHQEEIERQEILSRTNGRCAGA